MMLSISSSPIAAASVVHPPSLEEIDEQQATEDIVSLSTNGSDDRERKIFMQEINKFMSESGKPLSKIPIMGYKELDLFQLFKEVIAYGGFNEVVKNVGTWSKIWKRLGNFDPSITDSSFRLKKNYERYLLEYEYKIYPDHKQSAMESENRSQLKKSGQLEQSTVTEKTTRSKSKKQNASKKKNSALTKEVQRDRNGNYRMPLTLGDLTIESLGQILMRVPIVSEKHIWPVGFQSSRLFTSMVNPEQAVKYTSKILDGGDRLQFVVVADDDLENPIISHSPSAAWKLVLKRIQMKTRDQSKIPASSGAARFGLSHPVVAAMIRELPNAEKFRDFSAVPSSPESDTLYSPSYPRKRKTVEIPSSDENSESSEDSMEQQHTVKARVITAYDSEELFPRNVLFATREEIDDLESAVATLYALKYCAVY